MDIIRDIELRCIAHRLAAEYYATVDTALKLSATVLSAVSASTSYWTAFGDTPIVPYILAGTSTLCTIFNATISLGKYDATANKHTQVAQQLEDQRIQCVAETFKGFTNNDTKNAFIQRIELQLSAILKDAPLLPARFEEKAREDRKRKEVTAPVPAGANV